MHGIVYLKKKVEGIYMKYCSQCGNPMEDQDKFCNKCGGQPGAAPQYQPPVVTQPNVQYAAAQISAAPYKPAFWAIGLFILLGFIVVELVQGIAGVVMTVLGFVASSNLLGFLLSAFYSLVYLGMVCIGFVIFNSNCAKNFHPEKKLSILWAGIPWLIRLVLDFIFEFIWGLILPLLVESSGVPMELYGIVFLIWNFVSTFIIALLTWLVSILVIKAVAKGK